MSDLKEQIETTCALLSVNALRMLHDAIRNALEKEDALPLKQARPYGVREHLDFRWQADAIEREFQKRSVPFGPIKW